MLTKVRGQGNSRHYSDLNNTNTGVPQGTILGLLFLIRYINQLTAITGQGKLNSYADDTTFYNTNNNSLTI